jgi:hypothetical protein
VRDKVPAESGTHTARAGRGPEIDAWKVHVRFSRKLTKAFADLYETMKATDDSGDSPEAITIREFKETGTGNLKLLLAEFPRTAAEIESFGDKRRRAALREVLDELASDKSVMVPVRSQARGHEA